MTPIVCNLCEHQCLLAEGEVGRCRVRAHRNGQIVRVGDNHLTVLHREPIERKPLYHFLPGSQTLSAGMPGCNLSCRFCQNAAISQLSTHSNFSTWGRVVPPALLVKAACQTGCQSISFTYTEPSLYLEYVLETAALARPAGLATVLVTNAFYPEWVCRALAGQIDACNIDLKTFNNATYRSLCGGKLPPILKTIEYFVAAGTHVEVSTPLVFGINDHPAELAQLAGFLARLNPAIPWHIVPVQPAYRLQHTPAHPISVLHQAVEIGREAGLQHVYLSGAPDTPTHPPAPAAPATRPDDDVLALFAAFPNGVSTEIEKACCWPAVEVEAEAPPPHDVLEILCLATDDQLVLASLSADEQAFDALLNRIGIQNLTTRSSLCG